MKHKIDITQSIRLYEWRVFLKTPREKFENIQNEYKTRLFSQLHCDFKVQNY